MTEEYERYASLIQVTSDNHNKFYVMKNACGSATLEVTYGRVDVTTQHHTYPASQWDKIYNEKIRKGYVDQTALRAMPRVSSIRNHQGFAPIADNAVATLVAQLQSYAKVHVASQYSVVAESVTQAQIDAAQTILNRLSEMVDSSVSRDVVNEQLLDLYRTIPRKMANTRDHLLQPPKNCDAAASCYIAASPLFDIDITTFKQIITKEQDTLDTMRGQVLDVTAEEETETKEEDIQEPRTILDALGITIAPADQEAIVKIQQLLGSNKHQLRQAYAVSNVKAQQRYNTWLEKQPVKKTDLLFHGSRNENWWNILQTSLVLRPTGVVKSGAMFGAASYFANKAQKSIGYTSLSGSYWARGSDKTAYLALFEVHLGNQLIIERHQSWCSSLNYERLKARGEYDSVYAKGGYDLRNDEFMIYREEQTAPRYLVEISQ